MADTTAPAPTTPTAVATPPPSAPSEPKPVEAYSPAEHKTWRETGKRPEDAEPAKAPASQAPPPDDAPATDGVHRFVTSPPPPGVSRRQHERNELIRTATEAKEEARLLRERLADIEGRRTPAPTGERTHPAQPAYDGTDPADPKPTIEQFQNDEDPYRALLKAELRWEDRRDQRVAAHKQRSTQAETDAESRWTGYAERMRAHSAKTPGFDAKVQPFLNSRIHPQSPIAGWLMASSVAPQLAEHFVDHPEDFDRIARPASGKLEDAARAFYRLEARFEPADVTAPPADAPVASEPTPEPKLISSAPPPGTTLGTRPAETDEPEIAALKRNDFSGYRAARRRQRAAELAGR